MALAGAPILKEAGDLLPTGKIAKASTKELLGSAKTLNDSLKNIKEQLNILKTEQFKKTEKSLSEDDVLRTTFDQDGKPLGKETDVTSEGFQISPDDMLIDLD